ncbi:hypothetical protein N7536_008597 [Penicillium majusculum]|nr:hypothetical protein N7536_008597 [Penicillium majusculum]
MYADICEQVEKRRSVGEMTALLDEKITEDYQTLRQDAVDDGIGNPYAAIKFACYNAADPNQKGIMPIYIQILIVMMDGDLVAAMDRQGFPSSFRLPGFPS